MKSSAKNVKLASVDDLFSTEESRADEQREKVVEIPLSELHPFKNHPFKVKDDEAMMDTAESIRQYGVLVPAIARPDPNGGYELVAGHRRHHASEIAGKETMPVIVRDLDDDAATIIMPGRLASVQAQLDNLHQQQEAARAEVGKPIPHEQELREKSARLAALDMALNIDGRGRSQPEQSAIAKSERPSVLDRLKTPSVRGTPERPHKKEMEVR